MPKAKKKRRTTKKKRKTSTKKTKKTKSVTRKAPSDLKIEKALIENFVSLQKVMTNLSRNFDHLSDKLTQLLELFEISAKALSKKDFDLGKSDREILSKLDTLAEQNKVIARGLTLIHERGEPEGEYYEPEEEIGAPLLPVVPQKRKSEEMGLGQAGPPRPMMKPKMLPPRPIPRPEDQIKGLPPPRPVYGETEQEQPMMPMTGEQDLSGGEYQKSISSTPQDSQEA